MSTQQADLGLAKQEAVAIYERVMARISQELSLKSKSFRQLALEELEDLSRASKEGKGISTKTSILIAIKRLVLLRFLRGYM